MKNNVPAMRQKLAEMQTKLNWVERLDLVNGPAPLVPELAYKEELHSKERASRAKQAGGKLEEDVVQNDFKREMLFYRQAQAAVLEGLPRLQSLGSENEKIRGLLCPDGQIWPAHKQDQSKVAIERAGEGREDQEAPRAQEVWKEGAGGSSAEEAEGEEGDAGGDEEDAEGAGGNMDNILVVSKTTNIYCGPSLVQAGHRVDIIDHWSIIDHFA